MAAISKTELAALLGVSKPRISQYVSQGLPVLPSGKVDRDEALNWLNRNKVESGPTGSPGVKTARALAKRVKPVTPRPVNSPVLAADARLEAVAQTARIAGEAVRQAARVLGLPVRSAFMLASIVDGRVYDFGEAYLDQAGVERPFDALGKAIGPDRYDWRALADAAGETFNEDEWDRAAEALGEGP